MRVGRICVFFSLMMLVIYLSGQESKGSIVFKFFDFSRCVIKKNEIVKVDSGIIMITNTDKILRIIKKGKNIRTIKAKRDGQVVEVGLLCYFCSTMPCYYIFTISNSAVYQRIEAKDFNLHVYREKKKENYSFLSDKYNYPIAVISDELMDFLFGEDIKKHPAICGNKELNYWDFAWFLDWLYYRIFSRDSIK